MKDFEEAKIDNIIKSTLKKDNYISDQANSVFENFKNSQIRNRENKTENIKQNSVNTAKNKVVQLSFYQKLNRVLSVAAVSLTVVLVGGTALYLNKNNNQGENVQTELITYKQNYLVKNETLQLSNEQILKEVENSFVKAYMVGKKDVGIKLTSTYWNESDGGYSFEECYKVDNIDKNVKDIFIGNIGSYGGTSYVFLLMEDNTLEYVDIYNSNNNMRYFQAKPVEGLTNVVGLEQASRMFSYSDTDYSYVNAIRNDGLRKEIEIRGINNWNNSVSEEFNELNQKYINTHEGKAIQNDGKGDFYVDGVLYISVRGENQYLYSYRGDFMNHELYRVDATTREEKCLATGLDAIVTSDGEGKISVYFKDDNYKIYELDKNVVFRRHKDESVISEVTEDKKEQKPNLEELSDFERRVYESGDYYYSKNGHYCIKNPREVNIAYYIENTCLYRVIIPNNDSSTCVATYVDDLKVDKDNNMIVTVQPNCSVTDLHEGNVIFKEYCVTDSAVTETYSDENLEITLKKDGSLTIRVLEGGLARLGFDSKNTTIVEGVYYNMFGSAHGVENKNTHLYYASAQKGILANAGKNGRLCFVYEKSDGYVIAIDIKNAIECGSFTGARTSQCYIGGTVEKLYLAKFDEDRDNNGNLIPPYETVFILEKTKDGKERSINMAMPCENEE